MILIPRTFLMESEARDDAPPLASDVRRFMEACFDAELRDVRIHTDAAAARVCDMLHARALTVGNDILFAEGAYRPRTVEGRRLLAHELVHVLQQRAGGSAAHTAHASPQNLAVGDANDVLECEADRLADEALDGGLRSCITPDCSGFIRRAVTLRDGAVSAELKHNGAKPGIHRDISGGTIYQTRVLLHLTKNSKLIKHDATGLGTAADSSAMKVTGAQQVKADPKDTESEIEAVWGFHILQFFNDMASQAWYAGETASDGSMKLDFAGPTNYKGYGKYVLDADPDNPTNTPYVEQTSRLEPLDRKNGIWLARVEFDDHPHNTYPLVLPNFAADRKDNFLYKINRQFKILTVFVAVDQKLGLIYPLFHFTWSALYDASIKWSFDSDGRHLFDAPVFSQSYFDVGKVEGGGPKGLDLMAMVANAAKYPDNKYNKLAKDAQAAVIMSQVNSQDVQAAAEWSSSVPSNHFK